MATESGLSVWPSPAGKNAGEAFLATHNGKLYFSWVESESRHKGRLKLAVHDGGDWKAVETVHASDRMFINWADIPMVAVTDELIVVAWLEMLGSGIYDYGIRYVWAVPEPEGRHTWSQPAWLHDDRTPAEHGFVAMAPNSHDSILAIWLDGRAMAGSHGHGSGSMQLRSRVIRRSGLSPEALVDNNTCECCSTFLLPAGDGFVAAYRDKTEDHIRDIHLARWQEGRWQSQGPVHQDGWEIQGCPVNGPAMAKAGENLAVAWFTAADNRPTIQVSVLDGKHGKAHWSKSHPNVLGRMSLAALDRDRLAVSWVAVEENRALVKLLLLQYQGQTLKPLGKERVVEQLPDGRDGGVPKMVVFGDHLLIAHLSGAREGIVLSALPRN